MSGHREYKGSALVAAAGETLREAGERWTDMREIVFRVLAGFDAPASAYDIADIVSKTRGKRVAPNSVYRILDLFVANNLAKRVESKNAFVANTHPACEHDCIFLVCDDCGGVTHLDDDALAERMRRRAAGTGFRPHHPVMEMRGTCASCAA